MTTRERATPVAERPSAAGGVEPAVYVYGVVRAGDGGEGALPGGVAGGGAPVRLAVRDDLAIVLSDVSPGWRAATRADVEAHEAVLTALIERGTVVPMRFGVVAPTQARAADALLGRHGDELGALLDRLDGHVQMSVKAYYADEALLRQVLREHPEIKRRSDALENAPVAATQAQRIALGEDVARLVERQRQRDERVLAEPLAAQAADIRLGPCTTARMALNAQLLVARDRRPALDAAVEGLSAAHGDRVALRYVGPLAPYSFADLSLDAEDDPWG